MIHLTRTTPPANAPHDVEVTVECDRCERNSPHVTLAESSDLGSIEVSAGCAAAMARQWDHWTIHGRKHYCPDCTPTQKKETLT